MGGVQKIFSSVWSAPPPLGPSLDPLLLIRGGGGGGRSVHTLLHLQHCTKTHSHAIIASLFLRLRCMALTKLPFCSTLCIEISERTICAQVKLSPRTHWKPFRTCWNLSPWEACPDEGYCKELLQVRQ